MAICKSCNTKYFSKECPICNNHYSQNNQNNQVHYKTETRTFRKKEISEKDKLYKTIRYVIIGFIIMAALGTAIEMYVINETRKSIQPILDSSNKMSKIYMDQAEELIKQMKQKH